MRHMGEDSICNDNLKILIGFHQHYEDWQFNNLCKLGSKSQIPYLKPS